MVGVLDSGSSGQPSIISGRSGISYFTLPAVLLFCFHLGLEKAKQFKKLSYARVSSNLRALLAAKVRNL